MPKEFEFLRHGFFFFWVWDFYFMTIEFYFNV